jgi:hypothetical protein
VGYKESVGQSLGPDCVTRNCCSCKFKIIPPLATSYDLDRLNVRCLPLPATNNQTPQLLDRMISTLSFGHSPPGANARLSTSSSPQPSMSSASDSPMTTPNFDASIFNSSDVHSESRLDTRTSSTEIVPKLEETELQLADVKEESVADDAPISPTEPVRVRRARGRPRIHPPRSPTSLSKQAKARSKTGCTTCRKRKKKCDETKPFC